MKTKKLLSATILLTISTLLLSCGIGLGQAIDLEAPVLDVQSPVNNAFVPSRFQITGTATDNVKTEQVVFNYSYNLTDSVTGAVTKVTGSKSCSVNDNSTFSCPFQFDKDCEVYFEITAYDKNKNGSEYSSTSMTIIIDTSDPEVNQPVIKRPIPAGITDRDGFIARLLPIEDFITPDSGKTANKESTENKDYFQNQKIVLYTNLKARYGVADVTMTLYEVDPVTKKETILVDPRGPDSAKDEYAPEFTYTESDLNLTSGVHYIKPKLIVDAKAGQHTEIFDNVFAWESAYDKPHLRYPTKQSNGIIKVAQNASIPVSVFDDDEIESIKWKLVKYGTAASATAYTTVSIGSEIRDHSFDITASNPDGAYELWVEVRDNTSDHATTTSITPVQITNGDAPTIIIRSPDENSVPVLDDNSCFTIKADLIDNQSEALNAAVVWLPNGNDDVTKFENYFRGTYDFSANAAFGGTTVYKLTPGTATAASAGRYKQEVSKEWNFFTDFIKAGNVDNQNKIFMFAAKDKTENVTTKVFRMNRFTSKPTFKIEYKQQGQASYTTTDKPLITLPLKYTDIKVTPEGQNKMPIISCSVTSKDGSATQEDPGFTITHNWTTAEPYIIFKLTGVSGGTTAPESGKTFNLTLETSDQIRNTQKQKLTLAFDQIGTITSITTNASKNKIFNEGETIRIQANFDYRVAVYPIGDSIPYIQLNGTFKDKNDNTIPAVTCRAVYSSGSGSNTLYFTYKVPKDVHCRQISISDNPINLNGAKSEGNFSGTGLATTFNNLKLQIDSAAPFIKALSPSEGNIVEKTNGKVNIKITFNEPVSVESGTLIVKRTANWYIPAILSKDTFIKLFNHTDASRTGNDSDRVRLCGDNENHYKYGKDKDGYATMIPGGPYMQYTNGLDFNRDTTYVKPDLTTKYVLAYDLNINDTTAGSTVSKIRSTLEKLGYHKAEYDVRTALKASTDPADPANTYILTIKDSDFTDYLHNGVEYTLSVTSGFVYDAGYNYIPAKNDTSEYTLEDNDYKFLVGPVAAPVIRVNRIATNGKDNSTQTKFKIDCETPSVSVSYGIDTSKSVTQTVTSSTAQGPNITANADITKTAFNAFTMDKSVTLNGSAQMSDTLGDTGYTKAQKIYIKAKAAKTGFTDSAQASEGAYKTVLYFISEENLNRDNKFIVYGSQIPEAASYTAGWPLTLNGSDRKDYQWAFTVKRDHYAWSSWQINDNFTLQTYTRNFMNPAYSRASYGQVIYANKPAYY